MTKPVSDMFLQRYEAEVQGATEEVLKGFVRQTTEQLELPLNSTIRRVIEMGWSENYDN